MSTLREAIKNGRFSNWSLGRAQMLRDVSKFYKDQKDGPFWRQMMRHEAKSAVSDARMRLKWGFQ
jgi:hypothetical protein